MNIWKVLILCMVAGLLFVPAASAEEEHMLNSADKDNLVSTNNKVDYIISPSEDSSDTENPVSILSTQSITQGQTINHYVSVGSGVNYLEVNLNWGDTSDSLTLKIYNPSGTQVGGIYRDSSDGSVNGRIHLNIDPSQGYVQQGSWKFKVYGESVSGTQSYTFNVYQH